MSFVHSFTDVTPPARYDATTWTVARIEEAATIGGVYTQIDARPLPADPTPETPNPVDLTTSLATLAAGYYRFRFADAALNLSPYTESVYSPGGGTGRTFITTADLGADLAGLADAPFAIEAACETCRTVTDQTLTLVASDTALLDGDGTSSLILPQMPVREVLAVSVTPTSDAVPLVITDHVLRRDGVLVRPWGRWWQHGDQNVTVTYSHGYIEVPADLRMVAVSIARRALGRVAGVRSETLGAYSVTYAESGSENELTDGEKAILRKYRRA